MTIPKLLKLQYKFFTSLEEARTSIIISALRGIIFVVIGVTILSKYFGINGLWIALPLAETLTLIVSIYFLFYKNKQLSTKFLGKNINNNYKIIY